MKTFSHQRLVAASPAAVYGAFTDPESLARWWGPAGFHCTFEIFEFRTGGTWKFVMHGPDGAQYPNENRFTEIVPNQKIVIRHEVSHLFTVVVRLEAAGKGTTVHFDQSFDDDAVGQAVEAIVKPSNEQVLDKLQKLVEAW